MTSPKKAKKIIEEFKPDIVIGTGGYVSWPLLKAASSMGIPTAVHESNASAGVAVKQLKNKVDVIMTNFESTTESLKAKAKVVRVGNPISCDFGRYTKAEARRILGIGDDVKSVVLSCGGSLGAHKINEVTLEVMRNFSSKRDDVMHFHACGKADSDYFKKMMWEYSLNESENIVTSEYIYNMPMVMAAADVVICRAGAMTLSEVSAMRKAAIIVPSPNVTDNHQYKNAKVLADAGAAVLIEEKDIGGRFLTREVRRLVDTPALREDMEKKIAAFSTADVGKKIYSEICELIKNR
jgi:UDP-N-acetylglucosamine--N-acetylmuramyl-(pentapeptide) pyrophosphoryl-undecaprenol N-acetylglucosamine transferase